MNKSYAGELELVLGNKEGKTTLIKSRAKGLVRISPNMKFGNEKVQTYFLIGLGGGYVEGEEYKNKIELQEDTRAIITTQASTKVYKCLKGKDIKQYTSINIMKNSVLEYITDPVILYKDAVYKQFNEIYLDSNSTLIYSDGITAGWSPDGEKFQYTSAMLNTKVYLDNKIVLLDNLFINPKEDDIEGLGYFENYSNFATLLVIDKRINKNTIINIRKILSDNGLPVEFGISELEINGFVLRVLGNLTQHIENVINIVINYIRDKFLESKELNIRKY